jgi:hypothetical protein
MPSWFETPEEVKAAFIGHVTTKVAGEFVCGKAELIPIYGAGEAPVGRVASALQSLCNEHGLNMQVSAEPACLIQEVDSKCGHC